MKKQQKQQVLYKCPTRNCYNFKFSEDSEWENASDKGVIRFFAKKVRAKVFIIQRKLCPICERLTKEERNRLPRVDLI